MCVILVKQKGQKMPEKELIKKMFEANPDGGGIGINRKGLNIIIKGIDNFEDYWKILSENIEITDTAILHMRIKSKGKKIPEQTHPFPITDSDEELKDLFWIGEKPILAHNGTMDLGDKKTSDTMELAKILANVDRQDKWIKKLVKATIDMSRVVIMNKDGNLEFYGSWEKEGEYLVSNKLYDTKITDYYEKYYKNLYKNYYDEYYFGSPGKGVVICPKCQRIHDVEDYKFENGEYELICDCGEILDISMTIWDDELEEVEGEENPKLINEF